MRPALDPAGHRVPRTKPTCLLHTWRPHRQRPFALVLHLHQHESSRNLHLQYLVKNQPTQRCQSLITQGSDHPPVLEPHMVLTFSVCYMLNAFKLYAKKIIMLTSYVSTNHWIAVAIFPKQRKVYYMDSLKTINTNTGPPPSSERTVGSISCDSDWSFHSLHGEVSFHLICFHISIVQAYYYHWRCKPWQLWFTRLSLLITRVHDFSTPFLF
jgi:hypothetical protein